jgi:hypothetical protein
MIYDGATMKLYKNAVEIGSAAKTGNVAQDASVPVRLADNPVGDRFLDGYMEDARIYERALTVDELSNIVATQGLDYITDGLVHQWMLNGVDGVTATGAGSITDTGSSPVNGTPIDSPIYRGTILKSRKRIA